MPQKCVGGRAPPRTPLGELTVLPIPPAVFEGSPKERKGEVGLKWSGG